MANVFVVNKTGVFTHFSTARKAIEFTMKNLPVCLIIDGPDGSENTYLEQLPIEKIIRFVNDENSLQIRTFDNVIVAIEKYKVR